MEPASPDRADPLGLVIGGGGARAAYQVGALRYLARRFPDLRIPIITGVSAGAISAALLASHHGSFKQAVDELVSLWQNLRVEDVFRVDAPSLAWSGARWVFQLLSGGRGRGVRVKGLVDTSPLHDYLSETLHAVDGELTGVQYNLAKGRLQAVALSTSSYTTGQSMTWIQGCDLQEWERPPRRSRKTVLTVDHVMASCALPLVFPAVKIGDAWYGDGGIRLAAPLSPALHLGAERILAISTRYDRDQVEADRPSVLGYPPPAQVMGSIMNAVFLDLIDQDALRLERLNRLLERLPEEEREGLRTIKLFILRPSVDLGRLATEFEPPRPIPFRVRLRGLGTAQKAGPGVRCLLLFQPDYLTRLIEIGEADAEARSEEIDAFIINDQSQGAASLVQPHGQHR